jgi:CRP-like cAMP-binding protein
MSSFGLNAHPGPVSRTESRDLSAFVRSMALYGVLDPEDIAVLETTFARRLKHFEAGRDLVLQGGKPLNPCVILEGWAYGYKLLPNRRRQIVSYLLPGDVTDFDTRLVHRTDHSITSLTAVSIVELTDDLFEMFTGGRYPRIAEAFRLKAYAAAAIQREWAVNLGQRSAPERIGHILCELFHRLRVVGLTDGNRCFLPLTQTDLAETTGLSLVHVNKRLRDLRNADLISLRGKILTLPDLGALERASIFSADYLNLVDVSNRDAVS